jgi:hypothetical protein
LNVGDRFLVLGDTITCEVPDEPGSFAFLGTPTGRRKTVTQPRRTNRDPLPVEAARAA